MNPLSSNHPPLLPPVKPFIIRGPQNQTAVVGSAVTFQCGVGGEPLPDVLWRRSASGGNMPLGECVYFYKLVQNARNFAIVGALFLAFCYQTLAAS